MGAVLGPVSTKFLAPIFVTAGVALTAIELHAQAQNGTLVFRREILCIILPSIVGGTSPETSEENTQVRSARSKLVPQGFWPGTNWRLLRGGDARGCPARGDRSVRCSVCGP
jgi:hypothetical protein